MKTTYSEYRRRALKAWRTKRANGVQIRTMPAAHRSPVKHQEVRGSKMTNGRGWRLTGPNGKVFIGALRVTLNEGPQRFAIFSVPKR